MKVAIFSKEDNKVIYINDLVTCHKHAAITSRLEFKTREYDIVRLDDLVDPEKYIVGADEMKELIMCIDKKYAVVFDKLQKFAIVNIAKPKGATAQPKQQPVQETHNEYEPFVDVSVEPEFNTGPLLDIDDDSLQF